MEVEEDWRKHISCLPIEILIAILKWVVSDQLDLRSLEKCSAVCRCFYVASRSPDLWRIICLNMWGANALPVDAGESREIIFKLTNEAINERARRFKLTNEVRNERDCRLLAQVLFVATSGPPRWLLHRQDKLRSRRREGIPGPVLPPVARRPVLPVPALLCRGPSGHANFRRRAALWSEDPETEADVRSYLICRLPSSYTGLLLPTEAGKAFPGC